MNKEHILYIHGLGSDSNSSTGNYIKDILKEKYEVIVPSWDLISNPLETIKAINKFITERDISIVIASSLGAFYAMNTQNGIKKILINPCMEPSLQIPKLIDLEEASKCEFQSIENSWDTILKTSKDIFGGFGDKDELFNYQELFRKRYGKNMIIVNGGHKLPVESIRKVVQHGLSYFFDT